ncbi:replication fork protection component Swi3-domain-containing protein [Russula vinacea]|nr:replication fork protection component Swi3-domain-containing protein [Russula vinacea]
MDTSINDIWDLPHSPRASSNPPLFLPSDDDEDLDEDTAPNAQPNQLAPALDLDALRREADARNAHAVRAEIGATVPSAAEPSAAAKTSGGKGGGALGGIDGEGDDDGKKKRKPVPKLDEARLLGKDGLLQLVKDTKNFKPKGKGHETADLDRVLQVYQFWTHKLYPKTRFKETVDRVEKLCHSKRMQVALSVWRDEANGLVNGVRLPPADDNNDSDSDSDSDSGRVPRGNEAVTTMADEDASSSSRPSSPARSRLRQGNGASAATDSDGEGGDPHLSSDASHPPPSSPDRDEATIELDALLEMEKASHAPTNIASTSHGWKTSTVTRWLWTKTRISPPAMDNDEEMWDIMDELEQEKAKESVQRPDPVQVAPAAGDAQADDLDDMYL